MASHWPFGHLQPKLWAKEGPGVKLAVWLPTTKSPESTSSWPPNVIRRWKDLDKGYKFGSDLVAIRLRSRELWAPKVPGLHPGQFRDNFGTPTCESREKEPFGCGLGEVAQRILYGGRCGFPRVRAVVCFVVQSARVCPNTQRCPGMWTNHVGGLFLCIFMLDLLNLLPSLIPGLLTRPSTPF